MQKARDCKLLADPPCNVYRVMPLSPDEEQKAQTTARTGREQDQGLPEAEIKQAEEAAVVTARTEKMAAKTKQIDDEWEAKKGGIKAPRGRASNPARRSTTRRPNPPWAVRPGRTT